jgi:hypothetical protein
MIEDMYAFWSNDEILIKYRSYLADLQCTRLLLTKQEADVEFLEHYLKKRGIEIDITKGKGVQEK